MADTPIVPAVAQWLAQLIYEAAANLAAGPGLTVEVEGDHTRWIQLVLEADEDNGSLSGMILNFPYRGYKGNPLSTLEGAGLKPPPGSEALSWEDDGFARIWLRPDIPLIALAMFVGDILRRIEDTQGEFEITVQIEYGY